MTDITIPPQAVEAAAKELCGTDGAYCAKACFSCTSFAEKALRAGLEAWKPSWIETDCDNAGDIISRHYVLDITPEPKHD